MSPLLLSAQGRLRPMMALLPSSHKIFLSSFLLSATLRPLSSLSSASAFEVVLYLVVEM